MSSEAAHFPNQHFFASPRIKRPTELESTDEKESQRSLGLFLGNILRSTENYERD